MRRLLVLAAVLTSLSATSCAGTTTEPGLIELHRVRSGDLEIVLLSNDGSLTHGTDTLTLEFRRGDQLVDVGTVKAAATMPMAGLPAMQGSMFLNRSDTPGRHIVETDLSMSGGWQLTVEWDGPAGKGSASFDAIVE